MAEGIARLLKTLFQLQMQLSVSEDGYIHYGDKVMLVSPDHPETEADLFARGPQPVYDSR